MSQTASRCRPGVLPFALLVCSVLLCGAPLAAEEDEKKPALLDVLLPSDARLSVDGQKTRSSGEKRHFESPPLKIGAACTYSLEATWHDHTVVRKVRLQPGRLTTVDLRDALKKQAKPEQKPPVASFSLLVPPAMTIEAGQQASLPLRLKRFSFAGSIRVTFEKLPEGVRIEEVMLSDGHTVANARVTVDADAPQASQVITVVASSEDSRDTSTLRLTVSRPPTDAATSQQGKSETKVETKLASNKPGPDAKVTPPTKVQTEPKTQPEVSLASSLQMALPDSMELQPGRTCYLEVRIKTPDRAPLPVEPTVALAAASKVRLRSVLWTRGLFQTGQTTFWAGFAVTVEPGAAPGSSELQVVVSAGPSKAEGTVKITVKPGPPVAVPVPTPVSPLRLSAPEAIELVAGQTRLIEIQVRTADDSPLPCEPAVALAPALTGLRTSAWTASRFSAGQNTYRAGYLVAAEREATPGKRAVKVAVVAGDARAEGTLEVIIKPAAP